MGNLKLGPRKKVAGAPDMSGSRSGCILPSAARIACRHRPMRLLTAACSVGAWCCKYTGRIEHKRGHNELLVSTSSIAAQTFTPVYDLPMTTSTLCATRQMTLIPALNL